MLFNKEIEDLVKITENGLEVASFVQIRNALSNRLKFIYGSDIDLSNATADGVFVNNVSLIVNNILQAVNMIYSNLDIRFATGKYLDALCAFSNLTRKKATNSTASVKLKNISENPVTISRHFTAIDKNGLEWNFTGDEFVLDANEEINITLICEIEGSIEAQEGWIDNIVERLPIEITQIGDAIVGSPQETDDELKARRDKASSTGGIGLFESLYGALLNLSGVMDVKIYNHYESTTGTAKDGTSLAPHSIYVILRKQIGSELNAEEVGRTIFERLTPAIKTNEALTNGKSYDYVQEGIGFIPMLADFVNAVYWCECEFVNPKIEIEIDELDFFDNAEIEKVGSQMLKWLNSLPIGKDIDKTDIQIKLLSLDTKYLNKRVYNVDDVTINEINVFINNDNFYNYTSSVYDANNKKLILE